MPEYADVVSAFQALGLHDKPIIAHASLKPFGFIEGGAEAVLDAMLASFASVIMPTFTYKTEIVPDVGPPNNGLTYGSGHDRNKMAESFRPDLRADPLMGILPETLRDHPSATRTDSLVRGHQRRPDVIYPDSLRTPGASRRAGGTRRLGRVDQR